jgi:hypothetical protein
MHNPVVNRSEFEIGLFLDGQRICVSPECDARPLRPSREIRDDSIACHSVPIRDAQVVQHRTDSAGGARFGVAQFGMAVEVPTNGDHVL